MPHNCLQKNTKNFSTLPCTLGKDFKDLWMYFHNLQEKNKEYNCLFLSFYLKVTSRLSHLKSQLNARCDLNLIYEKTLGKIIRQFFSKILSQCTKLLPADGGICIFEGVKGCLIHLEVFTHQLLCLPFPIYTHK